jgi:hypothetical protein
MLMPGHGCENEPAFLHALFGIEAFPDDAPYEQREENDYQKQRMNAPHRRTVHGCTGSVNVRFPPISAISGMAAFDPQRTLQSSVAYSHDSHSDPAH